MTGDEMPDATAKQGRIHDLEEEIRTVYRELIRQYEQKIQTSNCPEEELEAKRKLKKSWELLYGYAKEYILLCEALNHQKPSDIDGYIFSAEQKCGPIEPKYILVSTDDATRLVETWIGQVSQSWSQPLEHNPCAVQVYEQEDELWGDRYIVDHPVYENVFSRRSTILFADTGCGKSACRLLARKSFLDENWLVIEYLSWEDFVLAVSLSYVQFSRQGMVNLTGLASDLGFAGVCVMVDNISKRLSPQIVFNLIKRLHKVLENEERVILKIFLHRSFKDQFVQNEIGQSVDLVDLDWSPEQLKTVLRHRLGAGNRQQDVSLKLLMETDSRWWPTDRIQVFRDPDSALAGWAKGSPRRLLEMVDFLFRRRALEWDARGQRPEALPIKQTDWLPLLDSVDLKR